MTKELRENELSHDADLINNGNLRARTCLCTRVDHCTPTRICTLQPTAKLNAQNSERRGGQRTIVED